MEYLIITVINTFVSGVLCENWKVEYQPQHICTVKGLYVVIGCSFYYPEGQRVQTVKWGHERNHIYDGPFIYDSESVNTSSRFQYIGDKVHNCSLKIHQVQHHDAGKYAFRFITQSTNGQWTGKEGPKLQIVDLRAVVTKTNDNRTMMEGDSVNLTCINSCDGDDLSSAFTWFKDGEPINEGPVLYLSNISFINSGNYTCSLTTHEGTTSGVINIDVEYGPKDTSVSPLMEVDTGSNISLTCSSHANPPVEEYTWFKMYDDEIRTIGDEPELHLWEVSSDDDGQYFCSATNKHGSQNSSTETLKVNGKFSNSTPPLTMTSVLKHTVSFNKQKLYRHHKSRQMAEQVCLIKSTLDVHCLKFKTGELDCVACIDSDIKK
uniref:B-cell receptor CD22 n=1 Tax=Lates calcarifer TaxID=8187 RepID=A0A4W6G3S8_LATCA